MPTRGVALTFEADVGTKISLERASRTVPETTERS